MKHSPPFPSGSVEMGHLQFQQLGREFPFGLAVVDRELKYLFVNHQAAQFNGIPAEDHLGKTVAEVTPHRAKALTDALRRVLDEGVLFQELEIDGPQKERVAEPLETTWSVSCYPIRDHDGNVVAVGALLKDITEQKLREEMQADRLTFEALLSALSAEFVNVPAGEVDLKIELGLQKVNDFLGFDRITVWQFSPEDGRLRSTHNHQLPQFKRPPQVLDDVVPVWVGMARQGEMFSISDIGNLPDNQWLERIYCREMGGIRSILFIPLSVGGKHLGVISFVSFKFERKWPDVFVQRLRLLGEIFTNALQRKLADQSIQQLKSRLEAENYYLRGQIEVAHKHEQVIGSSEGIRKVLQQVEQVAPTESTVLILGETGTGKELIAHAIHNLSSRKGRAMIKLNCATLPATLIEAELFGREKGAYTGATSRQIGRFEAADGSTIFLDEIGELPLELQAKLLRVLQEGQLERLGNPEPVEIDVRVIAATNRNLRKEVAEGKFREDLYYRLNVFPVQIPPLRQRREDIPLLVRALIKEFGKVMGKSIERIAKRDLDALVNYPWPGNIRELRNVIERAMIVSDGKALVVDLPEQSREPAAPSGATTLDEIEARHIVAVLERTKWRVRGSHGAAELLGIKPTTLEARMKKHGIRR